MTVSEATMVRFREEAARARTKADDDRDLTPTQRARLGGFAEALDWVLRELDTDGTNA